MNIKNNPTIKKVYLSYNAYLQKLKLDFGDHIQINERDELSDYVKNNHIIQNYSDRLIKLIAEKVKEEYFEIIFTGRKIDYIDFNYAIEAYNNHHNEKIACKFIENDYMENIEEVILKLQKEVAKHDEEEFKDLKRGIDEVLSGDLKLAVVATISSGKSTLINSMLGLEMLPSASSACTGTIFKIRDNDQCNDIKARVVWKDDNKESNWEVIKKKQQFEQYNKQEIAKDIHEVEVQLNIPRIHNVLENRVCIIDTPGVNNHDNLDHKKATKKLIEDNSNDSIILYVLNPHTMETNDDNELLIDISNSMKNKGLNINDRFIFVINKIDTLDGEMLEDTVKDIKEKFLDKYGIDNPKLFPLSATAALLSQKKINSIARQDEITRFKRKLIPDYYKNENLGILDEEEDIDDIFSSFNDEEVDEKDNMVLDLIKNCSLDQIEKDKLIQEAEDYLKDGQDQKALLRYSGIYSIEHYVNQFLEKNFLPWKLKNFYEKTNQPIEQMINRIKNEITLKETMRFVKNNRIETGRLNQKELQNFLNSEYIIFDSADKHNRLREVLIHSIDTTLSESKTLDGEKIKNSEMQALKLELDQNLSLAYARYKDRISKQVREQLQNYQLKVNILLDTSVYKRDIKITNNMLPKMEIELNDFAQFKPKFLKSALGVAGSMLIPGGIFTTILGGFIIMAITSDKSLKDAKEKLKKSLVHEIDQSIENLKTEFDDIEYIFKKIEKDARDKISKEIISLDKSLEKDIKKQNQIGKELGVLREKKQDLFVITGIIDGIFA